MIGRYGLIYLLWFAVSAVLANTALAGQLSLSISSLRHAAFEIEGLQIRVNEHHSGVAEIDIESLRTAGTEYKALRLICRGFKFDGTRLDCPQGELRRNDERGKDRPPLEFSLHWSATGDMGLIVPETDVISLSPLIKRLRAWQPQGKVAFSFNIQNQQADLHLAVNGLTFAHKTDAQQGSNVAALLIAHAARTPQGWRWTATADWPQGEVIAPPWKLPSGVRIEASGNLSDALLNIEQARISVRDVGAITASLLWDRVNQRDLAWGFVSDPLDLTEAMQNWLQPWLNTLQFPAWQVTGKALFSAESKLGVLQRFYAGLEEASVTDATGVIALYGVNAHIPWENAAETEADISLQGGRFGDLPFAAATLPIHIKPNQARLENLSIPMLEGTLNIDELQFLKEGKKWEVIFAGSMLEVSMPSLSRTLGWPVMAGTLNVIVPRIDINQDEIRLDGAMAIEVFDGGITVHQLRLANAFSPNRRFLADVTARNLDLGLLTRTFSFGSIEGRFDADVHDLEMQGWMPQRFSAQIASVEGDHLKLLSVGALKDLTRLGKDAEKLDSVPERSIGGFRYKEIKAGCTLLQGICHWSGIRPTAHGGILLMEGTGLPSINIIGYNQDMNWNAMLSRIRAVIAGKSAVKLQ